jgi:adenylate kinase
MRFFLGGVNGAGKTTLLQQIQEADPRYEVVNGSKALMEYLGRPGDYEHLRALSDEEKFKNYEALVNELLAKHEHLMLDSHYLNLVRGEIKSVTSPLVKKFDALLLLKVSPETVLARTSNDVRDRALFPQGLTESQEFAMLADYVEKYNEEFEAVCQRYGVKGKVLNGEAAPEQVAQEFLEFADSLQ